MNKKLALIGTAISAALALAGCGSAGIGEQGRTITFASNWSPSHPISKAAESVLKPQIEQQTDGKLKVQISHGGASGNEAQLWRGVQDGSIDMVAVGTPMYEQYPQMLISDWPWLYRDLDHAHAVWTGEIGDELSEQFNAAFPEVEMLAWGPNSARTFTSNKPLASPDDFAGQRIRTPDNPIHIALTEGLGAQAEVLALDELYLALDSGSVDGQDNGMVTVVSERFYDVQSYVYETNHIIATLELIANESFMDELTADQQQIVRQAARDTAEVAWSDYINSVGNDRVFLANQGMAVTELSDADRQVLIERTQPVVDELLAEHAWAAPLIDRIQQVK